MEITSFILGVCAVIILLMVAGTSVNYMTIKVLRKDIDHLKREQENIYMDVLNKTSNLESHMIRATNKLEEDFLKNYEGIHRTIDSRVDKLDSKLMDEIRLLLQETNAINQELKRIERNKDERINY
jgi:CHASE3 domain sensor protein